MNIRTLRNGAGSSAALLLSFAAVALTAAPPQPAQAGSEVVATDKQTSTPGGAAFTVPAGWSIRMEPSLAILEPPEADSRIAIVDTQAGDARSAVEAAWKAYRPDS